MGSDVEFEATAEAALQRVAAPPGFTERTLRRMTFPARQSSWWQHSHSGWRLAGAVCALAAMATGGVRWQQKHEERHQEAEAQRQFARAAQLTDHTLDRVAAQLRQARLNQISQLLQTDGGDQ